MDGDASFSDYGCEIIYFWNRSRYSSYAAVSPSTRFERRCSAEWWRFSS
jgi:hypothetical protein